MFFKEDTPLIEQTLRSAAPEVTRGEVIGETGVEVRTGFASRRDRRLRDSTAEYE